MDTLEIDMHNGQDTDLCVVVCKECCCHILEFQCTKTIVYVVIAVMSQTEPYRRYVFCMKCINMTRMRHNAWPIASSNGLGQYHMFVAYKCT